MAPGQNHVGLGAQAPQLGKRRKNGFDQLPRQEPVTLGQSAARDFGKSDDRLTLAIAGAFRIKPVSLVTQEVMKSSDWATGVFQEAQVACYPTQHSLILLIADPESSAKPQGAGVVVRRVTAFASRNTVDGVLNQSR